jgi:hypothetical protein
MEDSLLAWEPVSSFLGSPIPAAAHFLVQANNYPTAVFRVEGSVMHAIALQPIELLWSRSKALELRGIAPLDSLPARDRCCRLVQLADAIGLRENTRVTPLVYSRLVYPFLASSKPWT